MNESPSHLMRGFMTFEYIGQIVAVLWPNQITAANAGWRLQFRFAVHGLAPGVAEFYRWAHHI